MVFHHLVNAHAGQTKTLQLLAEHLQISCEIQDANVAEFVSAYKFFLFHLTRDEQIPVTEQQLITGMYERLSVKVKPLCKAICSLIEQECKVKVDGLDLIWLEANIYCFVKLMERRKR